MRAFRVVCLLTILAILLGLGLLPGGAAHAQGSWAYRWQLVFPFDNDLNGVLTVSLKLPGQPVLTETRQVVCSTQGAGTVTLNSTDGYATFANGGYLECEFPDIPMIIWEMSNQQVMPSSPGIYRRFWMRSQAYLDQAAPTDPFGNPLFSHPDMSYFVPYDQVTGDAYLRAQSPGYLLTSLSFIPSPIGPDNLLAEHRARNGNCRIQFRVRGTFLSQSPYVCPVANNAVVFSITPTTFYVGHSDTQQTFFYGDLYYLEVDPPVWGVGGG
ncbi:MAG: hypothetical protein ACRDIB_09980 [Ardenticatenaceae bacterium]